MGQYYIAVDKTKGEYLRPVSLGSGEKLVEFCYTDDYFMKGLSALLATEWARDEVFLCGHYAAPDDAGVVAQIASGEPLSPMLAAYAQALSVLGEGFDPWEEMDKGLENASEKAIIALNDVGDQRYVANLDEGVYYDRMRCPVDSVLFPAYHMPATVGRVDALPMYAAVGNWFGGYPENGRGAEQVGSWAGCSLMCASGTEPLAGLREIEPPFTLRGSRVVCTDAEAIAVAREANRRRSFPMPDYYDGCFEVMASELGRHVGIAPEAAADVPARCPGCGALEFSVPGRSR